MEIKNYKLSIIKLIISELLANNTSLQASTSGSSTAVLASRNSLKRPHKGSNSDHVDSSAKKAFTEDISGSNL